MSNVVPLRPRGPRPGLSERQMQAAVADAADWGGWMMHHDTDARRSRSGGWPDVFAAQPTRRRAVAVELKTSTGRLRPGQAAWLDTLRVILPDDSAAVGVCRPDDLDALVRWMISPVGPPPPLPLR